MELIINPSLFNTEIIKYLSFEDINNLSLTNSNFFELCNNDYIWKKKLVDAYHNLDTSNIRVFKDYVLSHFINTMSYDTFRQILSNIFKKKWNEISNEYLNSLVMYKINNHGIIGRHIYEILSDPNIIDLDGSKIYNDMLDLDTPVGFDIITYLLITNKPTDIFYIQPESKLIINQFKNLI